MHTQEELLYERQSILAIAQHLDRMGNAKAANEVWSELTELEYETGLLQDGRGSE